MDNTSSEGHGCIIDGRFVSHGNEECSIDYCTYCDNGEAKIPRELSRDEDDVLVDPGESYFVPF